MPIGMLVVLDLILNRITTNRAKERNTYIFKKMKYIYYFNMSILPIFYSYYGKQ